MKVLALFALFALPLGAWAAPPQAPPLKETCTCKTKTDCTCTAGACRCLICADFARRPAQAPVLHREQVSYFTVTEAREEPSAGNTFDYTWTDLGYGRYVRSDRPGQTWRDGRDGFYYREEPLPVQRSMSPPLPRPAFFAPTFSGNFGGNCRGGG